MECHKCEYNGKKSKECLKCVKNETYNFKHERYIKEGWDIPDVKEEEYPAMTSIDSESEQVFKNRIIELFSLSPNELLLLQAIINRKSLSEFAQEMDKMAKSNNKFSRQRAYETRRTMITKIGWLKQAMLTTGQRKELKDRN